MSKTITIPKDRDPFVVIVNGVEYKYPAGETVTVPDSVADVIEKYENAKPKPDPNPAPGGSVQPDWNQNDSSAADFIKNKPFSDESKVLFDGEVVCDFGPYEGFAWTENPIDVGVMAGETYIVEFDGTTYELVGQLSHFNSDPVTIIGNHELFTKGSISTDDSCPFACGGNESYALVVASEGTHSLKICVSNIRKLDKKYLPEALQFGEENVVVNEPLNITWDGNTEGLEYVQAFGGFKVSDKVLTEENLMNAEIILLNGNNIVPEDGNREIQAPIPGALMCKAVTPGRPSTVYVVTIDDAVAAQLGASAGTYFVISNGIYVSSFTTLEPIEQVKTVVHPINKKYLPDGIGGNMFINITMDDNDEYVADKTYDEISKAIESGIIPYCVFDGKLFNLSSSKSLDAIQTYAAPAVQKHRFSNLYVKGTGNTMVSGIAIDANDTVDFIEYSLTVTAVT